MNKSKNLIIYPGYRKDRLLVLEGVVYKPRKDRSGNRCYVECLCDCGNIKYVSRDFLYPGSTTKSCGCLRKDVEVSRIIAGVKIDKWTVLGNKEYRSSKTGKSKRWYIQCKCECGTIRYIDRNNLLKGASTCCGDCTFHKNGVKFSRNQYKIHTLLKNSELNYRIEGFLVDIALAEEKIAIEYDEWYWHGGIQEKDNKRKESLINLGWKVLRIKAKGVIPSIESLIWNIQKLKNTNESYLEIVLPGWGEGKFQDKSKKIKNG